MKNKGPILILLLVAVALGIALFVVNKGTTEQKKDAADRIAAATNKVISLTKQRDELETVNQALETNLAAARADFSNKMTLADANLHTAEASLEKAVSEAKAEAKAQAESNAVTLAQREQKISDLESRNESLDKEAAVLRAAITNLESRMAQTQDKLAKSEGNRDLLLNELKRMRAEKIELETKFNNLAALREQLHKLRGEIAVDRRLDWIRRGIYTSFNQKGAERLIHPVPPAPPRASSGANVELKERGGVKIQTSSSTNAPAK